MKLRKTILLAIALPAAVLCLSGLGLPEITGTTAAAARFSGSDEQKVKDFCKNALGNNASQNEKGACYQGYIFGYDGNNKSKCNDTYSGHNRAIQACRNQGYNGGVHNRAGVSTPRRAGGGGGGGNVDNGSPETCGDKPAVDISLSIGCRGKGNPVADMLFAIIRVLSAGVGLVVVGSIIVGGIQYSASRGDPQATAMAINRIRSSLFALLIFIFGYALLNFIIPGAVLR